MTTKDATVPVYMVYAEENFPYFDELNKRHFPRPNWTHPRCSSRM